MGPGAGDLRNGSVRSGEGGMMTKHGLLGVSGTLGFYAFFWIADRLLIALRRRR